MRHWLSLPRAALFPLWVIVFAAARIMSVYAQSASPAQPPMVVPAPRLTGTLFNSAAERARIDAELLKPKGAQKATMAEEDQYLINGWIQRGDGDTTVWVDGRMIGPLNEKHASKVGAGSVGGIPDSANWINKQVKVDSKNVSVGKRKSIHLNTLRRPGKR